MTRFGTEEEELVLDVLRSGEVSPYFKNPDGGKYVQQLEKEFAEYVGVDHAVAVSNGTSALHTAYLACGVKPRDEVLVPAHSFIATASMVLAVGAVPVFSDVDLKTYCMRPGIGSEDALVPVDLLGYPMDIREIHESRKGLTIIEDAAQALGSFRKGKHAGSQFNTCATWSGQFTKNWTAGEGGMVTTNDREIARRCKSIRSHGSYYQDDPGLTFNFRMSELHAAVGLAQLRKYPAILNATKDNADHLVRHLPKGIKPPAYYDDPDISFNRYIIGCVTEPEFDRKDFVDKMTEAGVSTGEPGSVISLGYRKTLADKPLLTQYGGYAPKARTLCGRWLWFDIHRFKSPQEMAETVRKMNESWP